MIRRNPVLAVCSLTFLLSTLVSQPSTAQDAYGEATPSDARSTLQSALSGLRLREIGPALVGGRIADIVVDPTDPSTWYVAVGSGGVWKTLNAGITWTPIFDDQPSYSIGTLALDPSNPDIVWVGTGENVSGRHVAWGTGVYRSRDGGTTWEQRGLERSEHIGRILIDPRDGQVVYVAAEGPLWSSGGERGLYKTIDGGDTWELVLEIDADTGVTDLEMDPRDPDVLYAASYQRRRRIWSLLAGGPGSGIHKSTDAGANWRRLETGLPTGDMGKIGLAVSPADPDVVYATIEADDKERGFYRSLDRGESWTKRNSYLSNGTGPHYYQEIVASPHDVDLVYQMDVFLNVTRDGGASFNVLGNGREKHSDNHALWIDPEDAEHLIVGTDASLYESFDDGLKWRQIPNLPVSQFYKLALDNAEPFYSVLGGAQDLGTLIGPARTGHTEGIRNRDWLVPLGADGYSCAFDPENPDIAYVEIQGGELNRYDRRSHEMVDIKPMPAPGDPPERFNWDAPILVSPHAAARLYFGSQRLWRSDDRGDSWTAVSGDLTRNRNRYELEMDGRVWSVDSLYDNGAMSLYSTLTAISESPLVEGLLYVGTDDGLIQVSENGGADWRRVTIEGVPELSFVNDVEASQHDPDTVFAILDAHKTGDYSPYVFVSRDRGRTWSSLAGDLPEGEIAWAIEQDHIEERLLFLGAEYGVHVSVDGGASWDQLSGAPTIAFRDLELQRRENDLVGATFGRGFYVLDDYSPLRAIANGALDQEGTLFPVRDAWQFVPYQQNQAPGAPSLGSTDYKAPNPPHGALVTYHLKETAQTASEERREREKELRKDGADVPFPGWERLREETLERAPLVLLTVRNAQGEAVRTLEGPARAGLHRIDWNLRYAPPDPVNLTAPGFRPPWANPPEGPLAPPGRYAVELALLTSAGLEAIGEPQSFEVKAMPAGALPTSDPAVASAFQLRTAELLRKARGTAREIGRAEERVRHLNRALLDTEGIDAALFASLAEIEKEIAELSIRLMGDRTLGRFNEPSVPSVLGRAGRLTSQWDTRQQPTKTQVESLEIAEREFASVLGDARSLIEDTLPELEREAEAAGAPWTPGRTLPEP